MRIVCLSDTHAFGRLVDVPTGDVLIHAGDLTLDGSSMAIIAALAWLDEQPHRHIVAIPGNHDLAFERSPQVLGRVREMFPRVQLLIDAEISIEGMRVWGSPWQPWFNDWAYNFRRGASGELQAREKWNEIPDDTAILVTHGPPYGILDRNARRQYVGCKQLHARVRSLRQLRLHVFGHIHESYG